MLVDALRKGIRSRRTRSAIARIGSSSTNMRPHSKRCRPRNEKLPIRVGVWSTRRS